ncbi:MAG TPA: SDR family NAD(P)-dependent oxidoreductase [Candidatus Acidoferrales bacterium]|nr:SDR family NAD(P)-dependent oxidoreductase [Candidatus Acidoferrales bacterium]
MSLHGKIALVTGAARGIGRATALRLADAGADVALMDLQSEVEDTAARIREHGRRAAVAMVDVADPDEVGAGLQGLRAALGDVDVLVSNAAIVNNIAPLTKMTAERWQREIAVNLTGAFHVIQAVLGPMVARGWGRIIVMSSGAAHGGLHHQAAYAASKAGLIGLVQTVTLEHARHGITCNAILPGLIETETVRMMPAEIREAAQAGTPARRLGATDEVAHLIAFLASDEAGFINGAEIDIDGGLRLNTMSLGSRKEVAQQHRDG